MFNASRLQKLNQLQQSLLGTGSLEEKLKKVTESVVETFDADFCRIWISKPGDICDSGCIHAKAKEKDRLCDFREYCLHLVSSSGRYTHIDGSHSRMPFGLYKLGRIAVGQEIKFLTNDVVNDPQIMDKKWARDLGLVSFAGYKLQDTSGKPIGVLALFSKQPVTAEEDALLGGLAGATSQVIQSGKLEQALKEEHAKLISILESMGDGMYIVNQACDIEYINRVIEKEFGPVAGRKCYEYFHGRREVCPWCKNKEVFAGKTVQWEWHSDKNNKTYDLLDTPLRNPDGTFSKLEIFRDITDRKRAEEEIWHRAHHDPLTGLPVRPLFTDRLKQALARGRRHKVFVAVFFLDLDNFKSINDTHGHEIGDELLKAISERLQRSVRDGDTVARMGGDEFVMCLQDIAGIEDITIIADKILSNFKDPFFLHGHEFSVGISVGISIYPNDGDEAGILLRKADIAMYAAKKEGKNKYQFYAPAMKTKNP